MESLSQLLSESPADRVLFECRQRALDVFVHQRKYGLSVAMLIDLLYSSGSRVQACLDLTGEYVDSSGACVILQGKGSMPLYCSPVFTRAEFVRWAGFGGKVFAELNYRQIQRYFVEENISFSRKGYSQGCGTKIFRMCKARESALLGGSVQVARQALGHRSAVSTSYYLQNERDKCVIKRGILSRPSGEIDGIRITPTGLIKIK